MSFVILLVVYSLLFIIQIILLVKCFKKKLKWRYFITLELLSIIMVLLITCYYGSIPLRPLQFIAKEVIIGLLSMFSSLLLLLIVIVTNSIFFLINKKKENKHYFPRIMIGIRVIALIVIFIGVGIKIFCSIYNRSIVRISANVIDNYEVTNQIYHPVVSYEVDGKTYTAILYDRGGSYKYLVGEEEIVFYNKDNPDELTYLYYDNGYSYIISGAVVFLISFIGEKKKRSNV